MEVQNESVPDSAIPAVVDAEPRPGWLARAVHRFEGRTTLVRSIIFNLLIMGALVLIIPILVSELASDRVTINTISVPASLEAQGLNGTVIANRLWDAWSQVTDELKIAKETRDVLPSSQRIEFSIPDSGISFESLIHYIRSFFGRAELRISGEVTCVQADNCTLATSALRLRVIDSHINVIDLPPAGDGDTNAWFRKAIAEALLYIDPVRGILALRGENPERTIAELRRLGRTRHPDAIWALTLAAQIMVDSKDFATARKISNDALAINPRFSDALVTRAAAELGDNAADAARTTIAKAISLAPKNAQAFKWRGEIEAHEGKLDAAISDLVHASVLDPENTDYLFRLGLLRRQVGDLAGAIATFQNMLEHDGDDARALQLLSLLALANNNSADFVRYQARLAKLLPQDAGAQAQLGLARGMAGDHEGALLSYRRATELEPSNADHWTGLGDSAMELRDGVAALSAFQAARRLTPSDGQIWLRIGRAEQLLGQDASARAAFQNYLAAYPGALDAAAIRSMIEKETKP